MSTQPADVPTTDADLFSHALALDPYPTYRALRDQARVIRVPAHDFWLITRYDDVRAGIGDWETFTSAQGVALLEQFNAPMLGSILATDPPEHEVHRSVLAEQLSPRALRALRETVTGQVAAIVDGLLGSDGFDAVPDLCQQIPLQVVTELVGLPPEGREVLLSGADAIFSTFGPLTPTVEARMERFIAYSAFMGRFTDASLLRPGSWGADIFAAVDSGRLTERAGFGLMTSFLVAGMDTTSNGLSALLRAFATMPEVWAAVQEDTARLPAIFEEVLRLESPVQGFFRVATRDVDLGDAVVPAGDRVLFHFGMANRDERHYPDAETFQIDRNPLDHLAFGYGVHSCAGQGLARLEARALADVLVERVALVELTGDPVLHVNPVVRGLGSLPVRLVPR